MPEEITVPVRAVLPASIYKKLLVASELTQVSVGALVGELVRRGLQYSAHPQPIAPSTQPGRRRTFTPEQRQANADAARAAVARRQAAKAELLEARSRVLREMHAQGKSDSQIGKRLGIAQPQASLLRRQLGLPSNFPSGRTPR